MNTVFKFEVGEFAYWSDGKRHVTCVVTEQAEIGFYPRYLITTCQPLVGIYTVGEDWLRKMSPLKQLALQSE